MKILLLVALSLLFSVTASGAGTPKETALAIGQMGLQDRTGFALVESLTTSIGARLAGTQAMDRASQWAMARMTSLGFQNVHREAFPMTAWIRGEEDARIMAPIDFKLALTALGGSVATPPEGIDAEIVLFRTYADLLAAAPGSLNGKIAVVTQPMVRTPDGSGYGAANPIRRAGPSEAARRGALAYLHRSLGTDHHRLPHTGALNYAADAPKIPAAALANPDADQLERLAAAGPVKIHLVLRPHEVANATSWNVSGEIPGREHPDEIVLLGGHLDCWDLATGAIDDGAGLAIVMTAGKLIAALPQHPRRTVRIVLFGAEEMDFSGPAYADAHHDEAPHMVVAGEADFGTRHVYAAQLPPGAGQTAFGTTFADILPPLGAFVARDPAQFGGEDTMGLQKAGVPVVSMRQDGFDYFDIHHTADDTLDKVEPAELAQAASVWAAFAYLTAETGVDFRANAGN